MKVPIFCKNTKYLFFMAKAIKKTPKVASTTFHNIMAASVQNNPKPKKKIVKKKP